jgi:hypothetical protein
MDDIYVIFLKAYKFHIIGVGLGLVAVMVGFYLLEKKLWHRKLLKSQKFCRKCGGTGKLADRAVCDLCGGSGIPPTCPICGGDGKIDANKRCSYCMGTGTTIM